MPAFNAHQKHILNALRTQKKRRHRKFARETMMGAVATDIWIVSEGALAPGNANLLGLVAADSWAATIGAGNDNLPGVAASDPWLATTGVLLPGNANLPGIVAPDPWIATTGVVTDV